jgi:hypothetical protein
VECRSARITPERARKMIEYRRRKELEGNNFGGGD